MTGPTPERNLDHLIEDLIRSLRTQPTQTVPPDHDETIKKCQTSTSSSKFIRDTFIGEWMVANEKHLIRTSRYRGL
jgi:hypothetical protein